MRHQGVHVARQLGVPCLQEEGITYWRANRTTLSGWRSQSLREITSGTLMRLRRRDERVDSACDKHIIHQSREPCSKISDISLAKD